MMEFLVLALLASQSEEQQRGDSELIYAIIANAEPLEAPRGDRLPLYIWPAHRLGTTNEDELVEILKALEARGMAAIASWRPNDPAALEETLQLGRLQSRLGLPISVSATSSTYAFFNGDAATAHIDADGQLFFDDSFQTSRKMGCPFAIDYRMPEMTERITSVVRAYDDAGLEIDFLYADWEIDGPLEWNGAWESSKRCQRCRRHIPDIDNFRAFQTALRQKRAKLQQKKAMLAEPVLETFPEALVGNYGVYPHDGYRYWVDYFEVLPEGPPYIEEGRARYREWYAEFPEDRVHVRHGHHLPLVRHLELVRLRELRLPMVLQHASRRDERRKIDSGFDSDRDVRALAHHGAAAQAGRGRRAIEQPEVSGISLAPAAPRP